MTSDYLLKISSIMLTVIGFFLIVGCQNNSKQIIPLTAKGPDSLKVNTGSTDDVAKLEQVYLKDMLDSLPRKDWVGTTGYQEDIMNEVKELYKEHNYRTLWTDYDERSDNQAELVSMLNQAGDEGLYPEEYQVSKVEKWAENIYEGENRNFTDFLRYDIFMTTVAMRYISDIHYGKLRPERIKSDWQVVREDFSLSGQLVKALENEELSGLVEANRPPFFAYEKMKKALAEYEEIKKNGGWPKITGIDLLEEGDTNAAVIKVKERLAITGDYPEVESDSMEAVYFSKELTQAVKDFQTRYGIEIDGLVGGTTLDRLNESVDLQISKLRLNLERLRWQPVYSKKQDYILVNLPEYKLRYFKNNNVDLEMNVVIGDLDHNTPIIIDSLEYITFSPTWSVPSSIAGKEFLPILRKNPGWLKKNNYKLYESWDDKADELDPYKVDWDDVEEDNFPYFIEQQPGVGNSLGKVKFMMPNKKAIYLHDTPADHLFSEPQRSFSHGCIRLEKPAELAVTLLKKQDSSWDLRKVEEYMNMPDTENVILEDKVPVYFLYLTAFVDENGILNFRDDVYGMDDVQERYLAQR